ncbi:MAG: asparagine synthase (glutamine-hydrolyzing) [Chlorobi bacterium]|nr:asparagine synthase (glutamine-hydrolyzing) [Chlorobiota bacterium]
MCGIVGIVEYAAQEPSITEELLEGMSSLLAHRGPDDAGVWVSPSRRCGFGFRRLAIIDLTPAGHQPMSTPDGRFTIVFNGEIYNHAEIRQELEALGYRYRSRTDTETILYGYQQWGKDIFHRMHGMWAVAIWDEQSQELICARDRIGKKPLYWWHRDGRFLFASEIKALFQHPAVEREVEWEELPIYLCFSMTSHRRTLFRDVFKLPAAHLLHVDKRGNVTCERYWSPRYRPEVQRISVADAQTEILRLLRQSVADRMMSDVPFGVFLSGGLDSSINVALMAELMDRPVETFTVGFRDLDRYNEHEYARQVSKLFGTNHHEILITDQDALPLLEEMVWHEDEPNGDPVCIPLYFLAQLTRSSGTTVIQVGEGSDEQFIGYPWMVREWRFAQTGWRYYHWLPQALRQALYIIAKPFFQQRGAYRALDYIRRAAAGDPLYWGGAVDIVPVYQELLFTRRWADAPTQTRSYARWLNESAASVIPHPSTLQQMMWLEFQHRLPELLLMRVDKITMAHSIEARVPFLDYRLVEFTLNLPDQVRMPDGKTPKLLLKKTAERILPKQIIYRNKQGFAAPVDEWMRTVWYDYAKRVILDSYFVRSGVFSRFAVQHLFYLHKQQRQRLGKSLYALLNLALWHRRFFNG